MIKRPQRRSKKKQETITARQDKTLNRDKKKTDAKQVKESREPPEKKNNRTKTKQKKTEVCELGL